MLKRKLEELLMIYFLEDDLVDIYVEGPSDKWIIENFLEYKKVEKSVIEIDTIDMSAVAGKYVDLNLMSNKDKLIALSRMLEENSIVQNISCVVDRDFDGILYGLTKNRYLQYTDFSCMESYYMCKKHIQKFITVAIKNFPHSPDIIIGEISKVLSGLFILRMVQDKFDLNFKMPKLENNMPIIRATGICSFDFNKYLDIYIKVNKLGAIADDILAFIEKITLTLNSDVRFNMNGHDFIEVLFNYINKIKNTYNFRLENFEKAIHLNMQPNYLESYRLFDMLQTK